MISFKINGKEAKVDVDPNTPLLWVIRDHLQLTGTKFGCGMAQCGACTVHLDGRAIRSCVTTVSMASGKQVTTIEGLAEKDGTPGALQDAFCETHATQCGYCTPGMIIAAHALLEANAAPEEREIRDAIGGNLCRCTGYQQIVDAVRSAAERLSTKAG